MASWLVKSEPDEFSFADQVARGAGGEPWTGVRNHQARNFLRAMQVGDQAFFYHTGGERQIVGVARVIRAAWPDPTDPAWDCVTLVAEAALRQPVTLAAIKADPALADMALVRQARLSVQPVTQLQWTRVLALAGGTAPV